MWTSNCEYNHIHTYIYIRSILTEVQLFIISLAYLHCSLPLLPLIDMMLNPTNKLATLNPTTVVIAVGQSWK